MKYWHETAQNHKKKTVETISGSIFDDYFIFIMLGINQPDIINWVSFHIFDLVCFTMCVALNARRVCCAVRSAHLYQRALHNKITQQLLSNELTIKRARIQLRERECHSKAEKIYNIIRKSGSESICKAYMSNEMEIHIFIWIWYREREARSSTSTQ